MFIPDFLEKAAKQCGFQRGAYNLEHMPTSRSNIAICPFFGSIRHLLALSSFLSTLDRQYLILCTWPGFEYLFPFVDEYWSTTNPDIQKLDIFHDIVYFNNDNLEKIYLPEMGSGKGNGVFVYPSTQCEVWQMRNINNFSVSKQFWVNFLEKLTKEGFRPKIYRGMWSHTHFVNKCTYVNNFKAIRDSECVIDLFTGVSRLAMAARRPFIATDDRNRYFDTKDYQLDEICSKFIPKSEYIYSFPTIINDDNSDVLVNSIVNTLKSMQFIDMPAEEVKEDVVYKDREIKKIKPRLLRKVKNG